MSRFWFLLLGFLLTLILTACPGGGGSTPTLKVAPLSATVTAGGAATSFTATLTGSSGAISWSLTPATGAGSLSATTGTTVSYTPPASVAAQTAVTLTATSGSLTASAQITVNPASAGPTLTVSPATAAAAPGDATTTLTATLTGASGTVNWSLSPASGSGTLSATTGASVQYTPPNQVAAASTVTLSATSGSLSSTVQIILNPLTQFYADPDAVLDSNPGTQAKPLKTLKEALARMGAGATKTTVLLAGTYNEASGETWGYTIPDGLTLKGNSAGVILQSTTKKAGFTFTKGASFSDLTLTGFSTALGATSGSQTLTRLAFSKNGYDLSLSGTAAASLQDCTSSGANYSIQASGLSQVSVQNGSFSGAQRTLVLQQSATASFSGTDISGGLLDTGGSSYLSLNNVKFHDVSGYGIYVRDSSTQLRIQGGSFYNFTSNASVISTSGTVNISGASFNSNSYIAIGTSGGSVTLTNSSITNNGGYGIAIGKGVAFKMRGSTVAGNAYGISVSDASGGVDLGTASDPGGNTIQDNRNYSNSFGYNLGISSGTVQAVGNTWNPSLQGSDSAGRYTSQLLTCPGSYPTLTLYNSYCSSGSQIQY